MVTADDSDMRHTHKHTLVYLSCPKLLRLNLNNGPQIVDILRVLSAVSLWTNLMRETRITVTFQSLQIIIFQSTLATLLLCLPLQLHSTWQPSLDKGFQIHFCQ